MPKPGSVEPVTFMKRLCHASGAAVTCHRDVTATVGATSLSRPAGSIEVVHTARPSFDNLAKELRALTASRSD